MIFMIFMILKILGVLMAELPPSKIHIHNASMTMRLSGDLSYTYPNSEFWVKFNFFCRFWAGFDYCIDFSSKLLGRLRAPIPRRSVTYRQKPLLCKLFGHCALAQRSEASERCSEDQSGLEIMNLMIFMIFKILGSLMAELPPSKIHIHNASITMRLSGNLSYTYPNSEFWVKFNFFL